ncbi:MAG: 2-amino-4-hydroxy-6-hydroxymethyldihydropteridine diphosphokinase [Bdellovibrionaceae bacterium]|nr:2-amino-4-hydroxy-6-hydroxymethyldihydropteridine diphosphokinase [Bdellovibrionales bacterium]MCB9085412.1 2-amino-4-hydroxy-6-hydroxymethyldihydropteridine diphosphokinase [Pseudobdellovibrionaceae bacterium]
MAGEVHETLVGIKVFSNEGQELLADVAKDLREKMAFVGASSVYRVWGNINHPEHIHDLRRIESFDGLAAVIKARTTLSPHELLKFLQDVEIKYRSEVLRRSISLNLLVYEDLTYMTPELTLPHPELHRRPESLLLAAEVWGEYVHPVLKENLYTLTRQFHDEQWGRFYAQGKTLLDF